MFFTLQHLGGETQQYENHSGLTKSNWENVINRFSFHPINKNKLNQVGIGIFVKLSKLTKPIALNQPMDRNVGKKSSRI